MKRNFKMAENRKYLNHIFKRINFVNKTFQTILFLFVVDAHVKTIQHEKKYNVVEDLNVPTKVHLLANNLEYKYYGPIVNILFHIFNEQFLLKTFNSHFIYICIYLLYFA